MAGGTFDYSSPDAQGTVFDPITASGFDLNGYAEYEASLMEGNRKFWESREGVAVYRRFRVPRVFSDGSRDMKYSLGVQLAALQESMNYKMDIPNFLEPWYGIGTVASAFGPDYVWHAGQAPAVVAPFHTLKEALDYEYQPIEQTAIGKHTLEMIEYFLDETKGRLPMSLTDTQSPLNIAGGILDINSLFLEMYDDPEAYVRLLGIVSHLLIDFTHQQARLLGDCLANPGHGFPSSRVFKGIGMSDDNVLMLPDAMFEENEIPFREKIGEQFGGAAFHSCGDWSRKIGVVKKIKNLVMADGAFSAETDPTPNHIEPFGEAFANTGVVLNARIVGDVDTVAEQVRKLWTPGLKLIVTTYCRTSEEQQQAYEVVHEICGC